MLACSRGTSFTSKSAKLVSTVICQARRIGRIAREAAAYGRPVMSRAELTINAKVLELIRLQTSVHAT
jgi:hypothetical protein